MPEPQTTEAVIALDVAGRYVDANPAALDLLGVSLADLLASAPDRFAIRPSIGAEQDALRAQWERGGSEPLVGTAGLQRADGTPIRVAYAIETSGAGFRARLWRVGGSPLAPASVFTVGDVLREWRAAERELAELAPGTPEWARMLGEIEMLRSRYRTSFQGGEAALRRGLARLRRLLALAPGRGLPGEPFFARAQSGAAPSAIPRPGAGTPRLSGHGSTPGGRPCRTPGRGWT